MGNSTKSMAIFNSYVSLPEGKNKLKNLQKMEDDFPLDLWQNHYYIIQG